MKKQQQKKAISRTDTSEKESVILNLGYLLQGNSLLPLSSGYISQVPPVERKFRSTKELDDLIMENSKTIFGQNTFLIQIKNAKEDWQNTFLLDAGNPARLRLFILEVLNSGQDFYGTVFPAVTRFFSFIRKEENAKQLFEYLSKRKELHHLFGGSVDSTILKNQLNKPEVLLMTDTPINDLQEIKEIYPTSWSLVNAITIKKYVGKSGTFCSITPAFSELSSNGNKTKRVRSTETFTEADHLEKASEGVIEAYNKIKTEVVKSNKTIQFNPQKYYIAMKNGGNLAFFHIGLKKISLVVKHPEKETKKLIKNYVVKTLAASVQKFWGAESCTIIIDNTKYLKEVISLLKKMIA